MSLIASFTAHDGVPELSVDTDCIKALRLAPISYCYIAKSTAGNDDYSHGAYTLVKNSIKPTMKENASKHELTINIENEKAVSMKYNDKEFFDSALKQITTETVSFSSIPSVKQAEDDLAKALGIYLYKKSGTLSSLSRINGIGVIYSKNKPINFFGTMSLLHSNAGAVVMSDNHIELNNIPDKDQNRNDDNNIVELSNVVNVMDLNKIVEPSLVFWSSLNPKISIFGLKKFTDMHNYTNMNGTDKKNTKEITYFENRQVSICFNDIVGMVNQNLLEQDIKDNIPEFNEDNFEDFQLKASEYIRAHAYDHAVHDFDDFLEL